MLTNDNATEVAGYSTFQDVEQPMLRAWNQYNVLTNLKGASLDDVGLKYLNSLSPRDRMALMVMIEYINVKGVEETKREIIKERVGIAA